MEGSKFNYVPSPEVTEDDGTYMLKCFSFVMALNYLTIGNVANRFTEVLALGALAVFVNMGKGFIPWWIPNRYVFLSGLMTIYWIIDGKFNWVPKAVSRLL